MNFILTNSEIEKLVDIRKYLHKHPELANNEKKTSIFLKEVLNSFSPDEIIEGIGGEGLAFVFKGNKPGKNILFRAELDALPILEENNFEYKSLNDGISHKCGHDGHMTILVGLAKYLAENRPQKGSVIILYQPAEETGEGAEAVLTDPLFQQLKPDFVFALHNLPGFKKNSIIVKDGCFAASSIGIKINLIGKESHAGHPEGGNSPALAIAEIINQFQEIAKNALSKELGFVTLISIDMGEKAYGTAPGKAEILATLRSYSDENLVCLKSKCTDIVNYITTSNNLKLKIQWQEYFPVTKNYPEAIQIIRKAAKKSGLNVLQAEEPFRWSEDFGHFTNKFNGALFGLGAGIESPQLHNPDYDFPDELTPTGINIFSSIVQSIMEELV